MLDPSPYPLDSLPRSARRRRFARLALVLLLVASCSGCLERPLISLNLKSVPSGNLDILVWVEANGYESKGELLAPNTTEVGIWLPNWVSGTVRAWALWVGGDNCVYYRGTATAVVDGNKEFELTLPIEVLNPPRCVRP